MSFYNPAPCPVCGMDLDNIRHVPHDLTPDERDELKRLRRLYVADGLGVLGMLPADKERLTILEQKAGERR